MSGRADSGRSVPEEVVEAAKAAFLPRETIELVSLSYDSLLDGLDQPSDHLLRFEHPQLTVAMNVEVTDEGALLKGQVGDLSLRTATVQMSGTDIKLVTKIQDGHFEFSRIGHGLTRVRFERPERTPFATDWFRV